MDSDPQGCRVVSHQQYGTLRHFGLPDRASGAERLARRLPGHERLGTASGFA